jgi:UDP-glucuronate decarboxylase
MTGSIPHNQQMDTTPAHFRGAISQLSVRPEVVALKGTTVCVVGCTGLIGRAMMAVLQTANRSSLSGRLINIIGVARGIDERFIQETDTGVTLVASDVTDPRLGPILASCDYVIYLAGTTSDYLSRIRETAETQTIGLQQCLTSAKGSRGFVYASSTRVYGRTASRTFVAEDSLATVRPMHLDNIYDSCKRFGESLCLWYSRSGQCNVVVVRLSNVYGFDSVLPSRSVVTDFVGQAYKTHRIEPTGHPASVRNYCYVLDAVQGVLLALVRGKTGNAYNVGSAEHLTTRRLARMIAGGLPFTVELNWPNPFPPVSIQRVSIEKARSELGFDPTYTFKQLAPLIVQHAAGRV